ncbi:hypothetical protein D3C76_1013610 [compost metagenome]
MQFNNLAILIFNDFITFDEISMLQAYFIAGEQAEIFIGRILHKVVALNINLTRERNLAYTHFFILCIILRFKPFCLAFRIIGDNNLKRTKYSHGARHS